MKTMNRTYFMVAALLAVVFSFASCKEDEDGTNISNKEVVFQVEYINHAWGYQHHGMLVNSYGNVYRYNNPEKWHFADNNQLAADSLAKYFQYATFVDGASVDKTELDKMKKLAISASSGTLSDPENQMADAGTTSYQVYIYDGQKRTWKLYLMQTEGDFYIENSSPAAAIIVDWLKELRENLPAN